MRILAENLVFRLVAACESIVEPRSTIRGLIRRCTDAIGLGTSLLSHRKKGWGDSLLRPLHIIYWVRCSFEGRTNIAVVCWPAVDWLIASLLSGLALTLGNIKGNGPRRYGHVPELLLNSCWVNTIATGSSNKSIVVWRSPIFTVAPHHVYHSLISSVAPSTSVAPISTVAPHQVHHSPISSVAPSTSVALIDTVAPSTSAAPFTDFQCCAFYKCCTIHQSPVLRLLQVLPIVTVALLQLHRSTVLIQLLSTIFCHVIMLLDNSMLSIILLPMWTRLVYYLTASSKSKFLQLQNMLPPVDEFILLSWFSFIN